MERLTCEANKNLLVISANMKIWRDIYKKLTAYEDTGLEPDQVAEVYRRFSEARAIAEELGQKYADRADELLRAEAEGRLVELPCRVGGAVYLPGKNDWGDTMWFEVIEVGRDRGGSYFVIDDEEHEHIPMEDIGKTVFLTREEAEAKLKDCDGA